MTRDEVTAIVPMREGSERVPGKNHRDLAGAPLFTWILDALLAVEEIREIVIDTDSEAVREISRARFPNVVLIDRPPSLTGGEVSMNDVLAHTVTQVPGDFFLQTHSTNPLLRPETIARAVRAFLSDKDHDAMFGVTRLQTRLWEAGPKPLNHDPSVLQRTQDLKPVYEENSTLYIFSRAGLLTTGNRLGANPTMFEVDKVEATDIDMEADFLLADALMRTRLAQSE